MPTVTRTPRVHPTSLRLTEDAHSVFLMDTTEETQVHKLRDAATTLVHPESKPFLPTATRIYTLMRQSNSTQTTGIYDGNSRIALSIGRTATMSNTKLGTVPPEALHTSSSLSECVMGGLYQSTLRRLQRSWTSTTRNGDNELVDLS